MKYGLFYKPGASNSPYNTATQKQLFWDVAILTTLRPELTRLPRNGPIYYVFVNTPDHTVNRKIKTAGRRLADFAKTRVWSTYAG